MRQRTNQFLLYIILLSLLVFTFQNCSPNLNLNNQSSHGSFNDGGGEPYPGYGLLPKTYVVNAMTCSDDLNAFIITKFDNETSYKLTRENCLSSNRIITPQEIEWLTPDVSFNFEGHFYEIK